MSNNKAINIYFEEVVEKHKGILFKVAKTYCPYEDDRQDLIQEMMIQIWKSLHKYNDEYSISTWLYRICLNTAISFFRKNTTRQNKYTTLEDEHLQYKEENSKEKLEQLSLLEIFIEELNNVDKALMLLYLEEKSHAEISEIMGLTTTNIGTKIGRIKDKLKKKFSENK